MYVLCGPGLSGRQRSTYGRYTSPRGINLQKFSIPTGKRLWSRNLATDGQYYRVVPPMALARGTVVVTGRHTQTNMPCYSYIVDGSDGKVVETIGLSGRGGATTEESRRRQALGSAVITNGRLVVETVEGVHVYGER